MHKKNIKQSLTGYPKKQGLYNPKHEKDACGFGFIANLDNIPKHEIIHQALEIVHNLDHRGAVSADPLAGDGAGILIQVPDEFFRLELNKKNYVLPELGNYGVGITFFPNSQTEIIKIQSIIKDIIVKEGLELICWRDVPVNSSVLGVSVKANEPNIKQLFIRKGKNLKSESELERKLYVVRKLISSALHKNKINEENFYIPSLSTRTIVYKGMVLAPNLSKYYLDFQNKSFKSAMAMFHQRFSTNTFPSWQLAQPFRYLCHNGEINTVQGNKNWINSRKSKLESKYLGKDISKIWPVIEKNPSDSSAFDNALELLLMGGYSLPHAMMLMIPEAWNNNKIMNKRRKSFYEFFAGLMEPWDGPAAMAFSDGRKIAATLDRNGLRPARYIVTVDNTILMASEVGVLPSIKEEDIKIKWRLQPGKMLLVDLEEKRIISDDELKESLSSEFPYEKWINQDRIRLSSLRSKSKSSYDFEKLFNLQKCFGYSKEDIKFFLQPMMVDGQDPVGSMGRDIPLAALSDKSRLLYDYFFQKFAQVTNPPIDPIREEVVMSLKTYLGAKPNIFDFNNQNTNKLLEIDHPILTDNELGILKTINEEIENDFNSHTVDITFDKKISLVTAINNICNEAENAVKVKNTNILIISDRGINKSKYGVPALIATSAIHHFLIQKGLRTLVSIVVETGEARKVHDICLLGGYGAEAINPYLGFATISNIIHENKINISEKTAHLNYIKSICKGMLKVFSKMGISTFQSYCGAQIFDAVGLSDKVIEKYFTGTSNKVEGITIDEIEREVKERHTLAFDTNLNFSNELDVGGDLAFRVNGEEHVWKPETITLLQHSVRSENYNQFKKYTSSVDDQTKKLKNLRGLLNFKKINKPISIEQVEPIKAIVKRFATGAMSLGSISAEAHSTLAIAMNRLGGRSNTGEGGEDPIRYKKLESGDSLRSKIKQVASGRFGVTTEYLSNADDIQIKMAQGAKPGEGGQLPGHKVDKYIASIRHSTPGVGLISPPPHHDIYSIEDLAQLIFDLKNVNPKARISVKLVSEFGVGTVAAGVSKAFADHVTISGHDGGTGASPLTSVLSAGGPWELGLAETHQTLLVNDLRGRIAVQVDGGLRTGRDVVIGALLGADEFGFATSALIAEGCIMMRKCHLNTCPVGVATQDPELRKHFTGKPEHIVNFFTFLASEVREIMADLGFKNFNDMIGQRDYLDFDEANKHWKANNLDLSNLITQINVNKKNSIYNSEKQKHKISKVLDKKIISKAKSSINKCEKTNLKLNILNTDRSVGAMLSGLIAKKFGHKGLPKNTINIKFNGSAGQSFGAWLAHGINFSLEGDANDYVGKGLSGGSISIYPSLKSSLIANENIIVGNTVLYGAISGECFINGIAGERFAVRNSGATSVVEGCGDHGCEYMTGGSVVILGNTGRNFAAGMSGGIAYIYDKDNSFRNNCNMGMVSLEKILVNQENQKISEKQLKYEMLDFDEQRLKILISKHVKKTNSIIGKSIIKNWSSSLEKFIKVIPNDFKKVLKDQQNNIRKKVLKKCQDFKMGKTTGFIEISRKEREYESVPSRLKHYREFIKPIAPDEISDQGARCMDCGIPYCHQGCPVNNLIPEWNDLVYKKDWLRALEILHSTNNFPEFTGRICPAPCEASCTLNLTDNPVTIKNIECSIVDMGWKEGWIVPQKPKKLTGKKVAVIGSGPSGLACAQQLARAGHIVTVYEKSQRIGGLLRIGIPDFKMEKKLIDQRIKQMEEEGVTFKANVFINENKQIDQLKNNYDAIALCTGAEIPRDLEIENRNLKGIHFAMEFLSQQNDRVAGKIIKQSEEILAKGKNVLVIGGGDTGSDCVGTSNRQGAKSVKQLELLSEPPKKENKLLTWPNWPMKLRTSSSHEEGCNREWSVLSKSFIGSEGRVKGLKGVGIEWTQSSNGSLKMNEIKNSEFELEADLVLLAMGFLHTSHNGIVESLDLNLDKRGNIEAKESLFETSSRKIFAAGDARRGQSLVVWAIKEGRDCASSINNFLLK